MYTVSHVTITPICVKQEDALPQKDPFTFSKMLFPVCKANHWCLAVAYFCTSELIWYDSMGGDGVSSLKKIW